MGCCSSKPENKIIKIVLPQQCTDESEILETSPRDRILTYKNSLVGCLQSPSIRNVEIDSFISHKVNNIHEEYLMGECICAGGLGSVRVACHRPTKQDRAIKTIKKMNINTDLRFKTQFFNEVDILKKVSHPNIVKLFEFYEDERSFHLVTELLKGGDLVTFLLKEGKLTEQSTAYFFKQLLSAVAYCHSKGIVHRDLKLDHLMLDSDSKTASLKIIDFGTAAWFEPKKRLTRKYGTTFYIAPEVLRHSYSEKCDVWSCGVILYILLSGEPPFDGNNENEILTRILKGDYSLSTSVWNNISKEAKSLITKLLTYDESQRISSSEALQDPWVVKNSKVYDKSTFEVLPIFNNLKKFSSKQKLQRSILTFIASQLLNKEETGELAQLFRQIDQDSDGKISKEELLKEYEKRFSKARALEEVEKIMEEVDTDKSGFIDYTEFIVATMTKEKLLTRKNLERSFKAFDKDNSGKITLEELKDFLGNETIGSQEAWEELLKDDENNNNGLDLAEFKKIIYKLFS